MTCSILLAPIWRESSWEACIYIYLAWFLLLKMPYTGNFFLYYIFYFLFIFIIFLCKYSFSMGICFYIIFFTFFLYLSIFMYKYLFSMEISKQLRSMYIYTWPGFFYWKCRILEISFYIIFFTFFLCLSIFMYKYLFSMEISKQLRSMYIYTLPGFFYWKCRILIIFNFLLSFYIYHFYM